jgi:hypothetical protein
MFIPLKIILLLSLSLSLRSLAAACLYKYSKGTTGGDLGDKSTYVREMVRMEGKIRQKALD